MTVAADTQPDRLVAPLQRDRARVKTRRCHRVNRFEGHAIHGDSSWHIDGAIALFIDAVGVGLSRDINFEKTGDVLLQRAQRRREPEPHEVRVQLLADRATALAAAGEALSRPLPDGLRELERPTDPDGEYTARIQALMGSAGVVPFSGSFLVGAMGSATTVVIGDEDGNIVAAAHGYLPHNAHSPYHRHAWGGLVAVADAQRGRGLGNHVNARMVARVFEDLGATHIYELVSVTNLASRRMVTSSGLCPEPNLVCGMATANDSARFTR